MRAALSMSVGICVGLATLVAGAEPTPQERLLAETLFQEGRDLMVEERWPEACRKLEASLAIEPLPGVLLNVAVCHEEEGRVATAWSEFREALALSKIDRRPDRVALARRHIEALEPRLPHLTVQVVEAPEGMAVKDGATALPPAVWGVSRPVDPGVHHLTARAPGHEPWGVRVEVREGTEHAIAVPPLVPQSPEPSALPSSSAPAKVPPSPTSADVPSAEGSSPWTMVGISLVGLGAATSVVGLGLGLHALRLDGRADEDCGEVGCATREGLDASRQARAFATAANVTLPIGAVLVVGGVLTSLLAPGDDDVTVSVGPAYVEVGGRF